VLFKVPACLNTGGRAQHIQTPITTSGDSIQTKHDLYFCLSKPGGGRLSESEWQMFLKYHYKPTSEYIVPIGVVKKIMNNNKI
jgi:hypothetical protein